MAQHRRAYGEGTAEQRELRALRGRVGLTRYIEAATEKRVVGGAEGEFNASAKHRRFIVFPLEILVSQSRNAQPRTLIPSRARVGGLIDCSPWWRLLASALPLSQSNPGRSRTPSRPPGRRASNGGRKEAADAAAWAFGVTELKPTRNAVHAVFSREDDLRNPGLQDALTRDLRMSLADAVDLAVFEGDTGANEDVARYHRLADRRRTWLKKQLTQSGKIKGADVLASVRGADRRQARHDGEQSFVQCSQCGRATALDV